MKHRLHVLGLPHTITNAEYCACAYTQKVRLFCRMMHKRGHHVIHYGHPDSEAECSEQVDVISRETFNRVYGEHDWKDKLFTFSMDDDAYQEFYRNCIVEIWKQKGNRINEPCTDFLLSFWNAAALANLHKSHGDMIVVEPGIGYTSNHYAPYKIFESYALLHYYYGSEKRDGSYVGRMNWWHTVIPNYFDPDEYEYCKEKENYLLFMGRCGDAKGLNIALQVSEYTKIPLHIYGQGMREYKQEWESKRGPTGSQIKWIGYADVETRKKAFAKASALILPGKYLEPFGGTQVQALLSGTPLITADWGAYTEVNTEGVGYRCRTFQEFVDAARNPGIISAHKCRERGERYTMDAIAPLYEKYFDKLIIAHTQPNPWYVVNECDPERMRREETPMANSLAKWIKSALNPKYAIDIGCGPGHFVDSLRNEGIVACGYDIVPGNNVVTLDITKDSVEPCELVICLEVLEHISPEQTDVALNHLADSVKPNGMLIFSAAAPNQGGEGHINCRPKAVWQQKLSARGLKMLETITDSCVKHVSNGHHLGWFPQNAFVCIKEAQS